MPELTKQNFELRLASGKRVNVIFEPSYFGKREKGDTLETHHFEFHGHATSETGYRSDFVWDSVLEFEGYDVRKLALKIAETLARETKPVMKGLF